MKSKIILCLALVLSGLGSGCKDKDAGKALAESEVSRDVSTTLISWGILGPIPQVDPEYTRMEKSVINKIHGVRGFTVSDDFHGDGMNWYEVELSPELATELRSNLSRSPDVKKSKPMYYLNSKESPSWWPTQWPADAECYEKDLGYFILPDNGTHAWCMRVRT
jgi:hypothetical protein